MKISVDHESPLPLYVQIEEQLRKAIQSAEYKSGKKLPNEIDLSKQLGVSRSTLRQAINKMVYEGLLIRRKGVGTVVTNSAITSKANNWMSFTQEMRALGSTVKNYELYIGWVKPTEELCTFFNNGHDTEVMKHERLRGSWERPLVYFISYFKPRIGLTGNEDFSKPLYDILENEHNTVAKLSKE